MGLLSIGTPLTWEETQANANLVREHGITQFINLYNRCKDLHMEEFKWGDEVEYTMVYFDEDRKQTKAYLGSDTMLRKLQEPELRLNAPRSSSRMSNRSTSSHSKRRGSVSESSDHEDHAGLSHHRHGRESPVPHSISISTSSGVEPEQDLAQGPGELTTPREENGPTIFTPDDPYDKDSSVSNSNLHRDSFSSSEDLTMQTRASPTSSIRFFRCPYSDISQLHCLWRPEYGAHMLEGTPAKPFGLNELTDMLLIECNMRVRRKEALDSLPEGVTLLTVSLFPRTGCPNYSYPRAIPKPAPKADGVSKSLFFPDEAIHPGHPRFKTLTRNIRMRRGRKVAVLAPLFHDTNTIWPLTPEANLTITGQLEYLATFWLEAGFSLTDFLDKLDARDIPSNPTLLVPQNQVALTNSQLNSYSVQYQPSSKRSDLGGHSVFSSKLRNSCSSSGPIRSLPSNTPNPLVAAVNALPNKTRMDSILGAFQGEAWWTDLEAASKRNAVYMDAMGFGMGNCCLQVTMQSRDVIEARHIYDQLTVICPLMLALTAATPFHRGLLLDTDARWYHVSQCVDDRNPVERGELTPSGVSESGAHRIRQSRYDSVSYYISPKGDKYNDLPLEIDERSYQRLVTEGGVDSQLAKHIAHLFIRDSVSLFSEKLKQDSVNESDHFENIQSTNWQSMRFKPPPVPNVLPDGNVIGWRVEFRPMELSLTDMENAAFSVFIIVLARAILEFELDFLMPLSLVEENFRRAQLRDAARSQRFYMRTRCGLSPHFDHRSNQSNSEHTATRLNGFGGPEAVHNGSSAASSSQNPTVYPLSPLKGTNTEGIYELTLDEIFNGSTEHGFPGLVSIVRSYMKRVLLPGSKEANSSFRATFNSSLTSQEEREAELHVQLEALFERLNSGYLRLIEQRASGALLTTAQWFRKLVDKHPAYEHDSVINEHVAYDLMKHADKIMRGELVPEELLGDIRSPLSRPKGAD